MKSVKRRLFFTSRITSNQFWVNKKTNWLRKFSYNVWIYSLVKSHEIYSKCAACSHFKWTVLLLNGSSCRTVVFIDFQLHKSIWFFFLLLWTIGNLRRFVPFLISVPGFLFHIKRLCRVTPAKLKLNTNKNACIPISYEFVRLSLTQLSGNVNLMK